MSRDTVAVSTVALTTWREEKSSIHHPSILHSPSTHPPTPSIHTILPVPKIVPKYISIAYPSSLPLSSLPVYYSTSVHLILVNERWSGYLPSTRTCTLVSVPTLQSQWLLHTQPLSIVLPCRCLHGEGGAPQSVLPSTIFIDCRELRLAQGQSLEHTVTPDK